VSPTIRQGVFATGFAGTYAAMTRPLQGPIISRPRRPAATSSPKPRGRSKLAPDPDVRSAILAAASKSLQDQGVWGLNIAAVLERAQLSTRAFYRHFESKEQLIAEVLLELARVETLRLRTKMANTTNSVEAVAAWIDRRLDGAFDETANFKLHRLSQEARSEAFSSPEMVSPAYRAVLEPLIEQLQRGLELGVFKDIVPVTAAKSIHGAVWAAGSRRQWATHHQDRDEVREQALRFCLRGLGVAPETIEQITASNTPTG
jgi:AcrR family transcriptional regulator